MSGRTFAARPLELLVTPILLAALAALPGGSVAAQEVTVTGGQSWTDHDLLGQLRGAGLAVGTRISPQVGTRLGLELYGGESRGFGSTCTGLIPPNAEGCAEQPLAEEARLRALTLELPVQVVAAGPVRLDFVPGLRTAWVHSVQRGQETGGSREASKIVYGFGLGADGVVAIGGGPFRLRVGGHVGGLLPYRQELVVDGYTPFEGGIAYSTLRLGFSLAR